MISFHLCKKISLLHLSSYLSCPGKPGLPLPDTIREGEAEGWGWVSAAFKTSFQIPVQEFIDITGF